MSFSAQSAAAEWSRSVHDVGHGVQGVGVEDAVQSVLTRGRLSGTGPPSLGVEDLLLRPWGAAEHRRWPPPTPTPRSDAGNSGR